MYIKSIERMDGYFEELLEAVRAHATANAEEWMILVCTNHGGIENEYEGKQKFTEVRMVPQIMAVCGTDGKIGIEMKDFYASLTDASNVNIVPTMLDYLGVEKPADLDGNSYLMSLDNVTEIGEQ